MEEGRLYKVDTRLRPSGEQGLLVTSWPAFERYHQDEAAGWERVALLRARDGPHRRRRAGARGPAALEAIAFDRPFDDARFRADLRAVRTRVERERGKVPAGSRHLRFDPGGIMDVEFLVALGPAAPRPSIRRVRTVTTADALARAGRARLAGVAGRRLRAAAAGRPAAAPAARSPRGRRLAPRPARPGPQPRHPARVAGRRAGRSDGRVPGRSSRPSSARRSGAGADDPAGRREADLRAVHVGIERGADGVDDAGRGSGRRARRRIATDGAEPGDVAHQLRRRHRARRRRSGWMSISVQPLSTRMRWTRSRSSANANWPGLVRPARRDGRATAAPQRARPWS